MTKKRNIKVKLGGEVAPMSDAPSKDFGTLRLTTIQLPEIQSWANGKEYDLNIKVRQVGSREQQDTKYDDKKGESIPNGTPYNENEFRIVSVSTQKSSDIKSK